ncbi:MAG: hypothetical protein IKT38_04605 [Clostridia bacterium]|nr:hypothetical protein [Clostridia bacterium]
MENKINKKLPIIILTAASFLLSFSPIINWIFNSIFLKARYTGISSINIILSFLISAVLYLVWAANIAFLEEKLNKPFGIIATYGILVINFLVSVIFEIIFTIQGFSTLRYSGFSVIISSMTGVLNVIVYILAAVGLLAAVIFLFVGKEKIVKTVSMIVMAVLIVVAIIGLLIYIFTNVVSLFNGIPFQFIITRIIGIFGIVSAIPFYASIMLYFKANKVPSFKKVEETEEVIEVREAE